MPLQCNFLVFAAVVCFAHGEVKQKLCKNATVSFEGDELIIKVDNPQDEAFVQCFGSTPDVTYHSRLQGYGRIVVNSFGRTVTFKLNRHAKLTGRAGPLQISKNHVVFESDGTINVLVVAMPNEVTVSLPNAKHPAARRTASTPVKRLPTTKP
uniref:Galectin n=1 Tax=Panagrellus redivivus TaxID=6233 RepID=A0A7E4W4J3_PANRE